MEDVTLVAWPENEGCIGKVLRAHILTEVWNTGDSQPDP